MNILFVNTTGGFFGGVEQNIALAAQGLAERGHRCYFVCRTRSMIDQGKVRFPFCTILGTVIHID